MSLPSREYKLSLTGLAYSFLKIKREFKMTSKKNVIKNNDKEFIIQSCDDSNANIGVKYLKDDVFIYAKVQFALLSVSKFEHSERDSARKDYIENSILESWGSIRLKIIDLFLDSNSVVEIKEDSVELCYNLGDGDDVERFESKFEKIMEKFDSSFHIARDILKDESGEETEWNIANVLIEYNKETSLQKIADFIKEVDCI